MVRWREAGGGHHRISCCASGDIKPHVRIMAWLLMIWSRWCCICRLSTGVRGRRVRRIVLSGERWSILIIVSLIVSSKCIIIRWAFFLSRISLQPWMVDGRPSMVVIVLSGIAMERVVRLVCYTTGRNHRRNRDGMGWDGMADVKGGWIVAFGDCGIDPVASEGLGVDTIAS